MTAAAVTDAGPARVKPLEIALATIGLATVVLALPFVLLLSGPLGGWALGAGLFIASTGVQRFIAKISEDMDPTHAVGLAGISSIGRAVVVVMLLFVIALKVDETVGLTAAGVFAAGFTMDLMARTALFAIKEKERKIAKEDVEQ